MAAQIPKTYKNVSGATDTWVDVTLADDEVYVVLSQDEFTKWRDDSKVTTDLASGDLEVADESGTLTAAQAKVHTDFLDETDNIRFEVEGGGGGGGFGDLAVGEFVTSKVAILTAGKVFCVSNADTEYGFAEDKLAAGTNISFATLAPGGDEVLEISQTNPLIEYNYFSHDAAEVTTDDAWDIILSEATPSLSGGDYIIHWTCEQTSTKAAKPLGVRARVDAVVINEVSSGITSKNEFYLRGGFIEVTLTAAVHTLEIAHGLTTGGGVSTIQNSRIYIYKVGS